MSSAHSLSFGSIMPPLFVPDDFEDFIGRFVPMAAACERELFDEWAAPCHDSLVIVGAGALGQKIAQGLFKLGVRPVAFADNDSARWGSSLFGVPILSLEEAATLCRHKAVFVVSVWTGGFGDHFLALIQQLQGLGCERVVTFLPLFWRNPEIFLPHFRVALPGRMAKQVASIRQAYSLCADDLSRQIYYMHLCWLFGIASPPTQLDDSPTYFPPDLIKLGSKEVFVDCGAYDGDTLKQFLSCVDHFHQVLAIEPDSVNFAKLQAFCDELPAAIRSRIRLTPVALGASSGRVRFADSRGLLSKISDEGPIEVESCALDDMLTDLIPTYVKMDIEGAEPDALRGMKRVIQEHRPRLAVCVYHDPDHMWQIPLLIDSLDHNYRLYLRHYSRTADVVCYATRD